MQNKDSNMIKRIMIIALLALAAYYALLFANEPQTRVLATDRLLESSGLARSLMNKDILYSHNDSGGEASVFAIDTSGNLVAEIRLDNVKNRDWEEIATWRHPKTNTAYIYVGEIGDNKARYQNLSFYRFAEPQLTDCLIVVNDYDKIDFVYEDGARDAEAFFVEPKTGDIYIISKREDQVGIYKLPYPQQTGVILRAEKMGVMQMNWVTAADISPDGKQILVKNYGSVRKFRVRGNAIVKALSGKGKDLPYQLEPQGEAICFDHSGKGYYTLSEAAEGRDQILYYYK